MTLKLWWSQLQMDDHHHYLFLFFLFGRRLHCNHQLADVVVVDDDDCSYLQHDQLRRYLLLVLQRLPRFDSYSPPARVLQQRLLLCRLRSYYRHHYLVVDDDVVAVAVVDVVDVLPPARHYLVFLSERLRHHRSNHRHLLVSFL